MRLLFLLSLTLCFIKVDAHPVSFEGGTSLMSEMSPLNQEISLIYSPKWWLGTGLIYDRKTDSRELISAQLAYLAKRWNLPESQGNVYIFGGLGGSKIGIEIDPDAEFDEAFYRLGLQADFETRKVYTAIRYVENRLTADSDLIYSRFSFRNSFLL